MGAPSSNSPTRNTTPSAWGGEGGGWAQLLTASLRPCATPQARPRGTREAARLSGTLRHRPLSPRERRRKHRPAPTREATGRAEHAGAGPGRLPRGPGGAQTRDTPPCPHLPPRARPVPPPPRQRQEVPPLRPPGIGGRPTGRCRLGCYYGSQTRRSALPPGGHVAARPPVGAHHPHKKGTGRAAAGPTRAPATSVAALQGGRRSFPCGRRVSQRPSPCLGVRGLCLGRAARMAAGSCPRWAAGPCVTGQERVCDAAVAQRRYVETIIWHKVADSGRFVLFSRTSEPKCCRVD